MLQGLLDKLQSGQKQAKGNDMCFMCQKVGEITSASSWCSDCEITLCRRCVKMHLEDPTTMKHDTFDLFAGVNVKQRRKIKCKEHENEEIKFIYKDCNTVVKHRECKNVVTIKSMIPEIKSVLTEKRRILGQNMEANITVVRTEESNVEKLKYSVKRTEKEIKSTIENAIILLRKREKYLLKELHDASDEQIAEHQAKVKADQITTQVYQQHCTFIDQALQSESEVDMYDMYLGCLSGVVDYVKTTESDITTTSVAEEMKFTPNMEPLHKAIAEIGKMDGAYLPGKRDLDAMTPVLNDTNDIQQVKDTTSADPIDVTVLVVGGVEPVVFATMKENV